jgi:TetR/AcrR family transcriptional regulator
VTTTARARKARARPAPQRSRRRATAEPRRRDPVATRKKLLAAAEVEFAIHGFQGARLAVIAHNAGVRPPLIHHYFVDKDGIYRAMLESAFAETEARSMEILESDAELGTVIERFVDMLFDFHTRHENLLHILRRESLGGAPASELTREIVRQRVLPSLDGASTYLAGCSSRGELRRGLGPGDVILAALALCAFPFAEQGFLEACMPEGLVADDAGRSRRKAAIVDALWRYCAP